MSWKVILLVLYHSVKTSLRLLLNKIFIIFLDYYYDKDWGEGWRGWVGQVVYGEEGDGFFVICFVTVGHKRKGFFPDEFNHFHQFRREKPRLSFVKCLTFFYSPATRRQRSRSYIWVLYTRLVYLSTVWWPNKEWIPGPSPSLTRVL